MLTEEQSSNTDFSTLNSETSRALHCMTAHLHRYGSELVLLSDIVQDIKRYNTEFHDKFVKYGIRPIKALDHISRSLDQISSHLSSISQFRKELQLKTDNVLSLVRCPCIPLMLHFLYIPVMLRFVDIAGRQRTNHEREAPSRKQQSHASDPKSGP